MRYRHLGSIVAPLAAAIVGISLGCSGPDPTSDDWDNAPSGWGTPREGQRNPTGLPTAPPTSTGTTPPGGDGGPPPGDGGGTDSGPAVKVTAFTGAPAFVGGAPPGKSSVEAHGANGNKGMECMGCHAPGKDASAPDFAFAGTVGNNKAGLEVRVATIVGNTVTEICGIVKTDAVGNFWCKAGTIAGADSKAAVRSATGVSAMNGAIVTAGCNSAATCHGGAQGLIKGP